MTDTAGKIAVVLLNLGGPDSPAAVQPFLYNLFNDPAIIRVPRLLRPLLARIISSRRAPVARKIYAQLGGGSPLLANTQAQAAALQAALVDSGEVRCFIAMRYWHPMAPETAKQVAAFAPDQVILLPLYPQFSTTTTASSIGAWVEAASRAGLKAPTKSLCCYPDEPGFISATANGVRTALAGLSGPAKPRLLFSAHGLPKKIVDGGDPYRWQIERTAAAVLAELDMRDLDSVVCFQSRVGPLEWIKPSTDEEIRRAGADGVPVVICPIAFVSEHSETLVEIEIEYRHMARAVGVPEFIRVPAVAAAEPFIQGLASLVRGLIGDRRKSGIASRGGCRICPEAFSGCPSL